MNHLPIILPSNGPLNGEIPVDGCLPWLTPAAQTVDLTESMCLDGFHDQIHVLGRLPCQVHVLGQFPCPSPRAWLVKLGRLQDSLQISVDDLPNRLPIPSSAKTG